MATTTITDGTNDLIFIYIYYGNIYNSGRENKG